MTLDPSVEILRLRAGEVAFVGVAVLVFGPGDRSEELEVLREPVLDVESHGFVLGSGVRGVRRDPPIERELQAAATRLLSTAKFCPRPKPRVTAVT